jgi:XTP/dITP diphosphohydrolase
MEEVIENWEAIKAKEKGRTSSLDGIAMAQPALALVEKLIYRAEKYKVVLPMADVASASAQVQSAPSEETVGEALAAIIALAHQHGIDPESSLRGHARAMIEKIRESEAG